MAAGMNVFVRIGAKLLPSLMSAPGAVERRFGQMNRRLRIQAAETKAAYKEMAGAMKPLAGIAAAGGLSTGLKGIFGAGNAYAHEIAMMRAGGRTVKEMSEGIRQANRTIREVPTATLTDSIKILNETTGAFGNFHHALENLSFNSKFGSMMTNMLGIDPSEVPHALNSAVQALEIRGTAMDPTKYRSDMNALFKAMVFTRGRFNPEELMGFAKTGNIPLKLYNQRFLSRVLPSLITELGGGDIVGTQAAAFRNQIMGRVPLGGKKLVQEWVRLGLVPPVGTGGNLSKTGWTAGTVKGHDIAMRDPFEWIEKVMLPAFAAKGIDINNQQAVLLQLGKMFGRETAMRFVATMADPRQRARLHKDEKMIGKAMPMDQAFKFMLETDPNMAIAKTMASFENLKVRLGSLLTDDFIKAMNGVAKGFNFLADAAERNPGIAKAAVALMGLGAVGATLSVLGIGLRFVIGPLGVFFRALSWGAALLPRVGNLFAWFFRTGLGRAVAGGAVRLLSGLGAALGPLFMRGLMLVGPWILRGLAAAFGLLSNPVGWAILAASIGVLIYKYRAELAAGWNKVVAWFTSSAWPMIKNTVSALAGWGSAVVDSLIRGISANWGRFKSWIASKWAEALPTWAGGTPAASGPKLAGARAAGGPVSGGKTYLVGERGPELFTADRSGVILPADVTRAMLQPRAGAPIGAGAAGGGARSIHIGKIVVEGAQDPMATARAVRAELARLEREQEAAMND